MINRLAFIYVGLICVKILNANVVFSEPTYSSEWDSLTIYFDASKGDRGLVDFNGRIWAHTGVITEQSTHPTDWKYVKTNWAQNTSSTELSLISNNLWKLDIGFPHIFFGVPTDEQIIKIAFVFRNQDGTQSGRAEGGDDIFLELYEPGITTKILSPKIDFTLDDVQRSPAFGFLDETLSIKITSATIGTEQSLIKLFLDDFLHEVVSSETLSTAISLDLMEIGMHQLTAVSIDTAGLTDTSFFYLMVNQYPEELQRPEGTQNGINYSSTHSVTLSLFAPFKEFVYVIGDFNDWRIDRDYFMKKSNGSSDSSHFWITIDNLSPGLEYSFQYLVDGEIRIADPFADKILDNAHDHNIPFNTYPNLKSYPFGKTNQIVSVLQTDQDNFVWQHDESFTKPPKSSLIIYELLIRDFINNHDFETLIDTLHYLKDLGINAIELMPFNEFEGNSSWGYNTSFYFAPDKYYGPKNQIKLFIDECHRLGIAVIMDIVLNHTYGQSPFLRLYNGGDFGNPTAENPWYNAQSNFTNPEAQWGFDLNHESHHTQSLIDRINKYWVEEYKIDGFRFDFTKGFGNNIKADDDPWGSNFDPDRIRLLQRMADQIWENDSNTYIILEHFADNSEEQVLADYGMLLWGNMSYSYSEASMGYHEQEKSDFSWGYYKKRGWSKPHLITYFESHDEERIMYKNLTWGRSYNEYNIKDKTIALNRIKAIGAFFFTLPGPKMLWQFGEVGYDISISDPCRLCEKPINWQYLEEPDRAKLFKTFKALIKLRNENSIFNDSESTIQLSLNNLDGSKEIKLQLEDKNAIVIGNFGVRDKLIYPNFQHTGVWYDYFTGDSFFVETFNYAINMEPGQFHIFTDRFINPPEQNILLANDDLAHEEYEIGFLKSYPNPFNPMSNMSFKISIGGEIKLQIYNLNGSLVETLIEKKLHPGQYFTQWDGSTFSSGIYFVKLISSESIISKKIILLK